MGMRIKQTLTSEHVLVDGHGTELTVGDLLGRPTGGAPGFNPSQSGAFSLVQATYSGMLLGVAGRGLPIPNFRGEMEVRLHSDILRLAGRYKQFLGWRDTRIKIPLGLIMRAQVQGSRLDLWLRSSTDVVVTKDAPLQRLSLDVFSKESARELLASLPSVPGPEPAQSQAVNIPASNAMMAWGAMIAVVAVIGFVVLMLLFRRVV
ncbi:MAG: hypothetical protein EON92_03990 [Burkholderiales bacterium]|nr:MAG: hypothetical protein EON92_03990 [Burkholderiales bacterium]